jgi:hypothetical protein
MASNPERTALGGGEAPVRAGPDSVSRRGLLRGALGGLAGLVMAACGRPRAPESTKASRLPTPEGAATGGGGGGARGPSTGGLLAYAEHNPDAPTELTAGPEAWSDVDPEGLKVSFTAPLSGRVLVVINAVAAHSDRSVVSLWGIRGTDGDPSEDGLLPDSGRLMMAATTARYRKTYRHLAAVQAGRSYTWSFAFRAYPHGRVSVLCGRDPASPTAAEGFGPSHVEVWDAG